MFVCTNNRKIEDKEEAIREKGENWEKAKAEGVRHKGGQIPRFNFEKSMHLSVRMSLQNENIYSYQLFFYPFSPPE